MTRHFRKLLLLPAIAAVALVSGCVSYGYRAGHGDYYYGQPTTEYVYPYGYYDYGYPGYYGAPYWSSFGYYGYYGPYRPHQGGHGHGNGNGHGNGHGNGSGNHTPPPEPGSSRPPWRNLDQLRRRQQADGGALRPAPSGISGTAPRPVISSPAPRRDDSGLGQRIRQAQEAPRRRTVQEQEP